MGEIILSGNYVRNFLGAPGIIEDLFDNLPAIAIPGTLFIATDTKELYRFNGVSWDQIGGGGGVTPTWQDTLIAGSLLTQDNVIDVGDNNLRFNNFNILEFAGNDFVLQSDHFNIASSSISDDGYITTAAGLNFRAGSYITSFSQSGTALSDNDGSEISFGNSSSLNLITPDGSFYQQGSSGEIAINGQSGLFLQANGNISVSMINEFQMQDFINNNTINSDSSGVSIFANNFGIALESAQGQFFHDADGSSFSFGNSSDMLFNSPAGISFTSANQLTFDSSTSTIEMDAFAGINVNNTVNIKAGITFPSTSAPATSVIILPTTVYGGSTALLGNPSAWIGATVGGVPFKIPCY